MVLRSVGRRLALAMLSVGLLLALLIVTGVRQLTLDHLLFGRIMLSSVRYQGGEG